MSSEEVIGGLKSITDPSSAPSHLPLGQPDAQLVHAPEACNYMLQLLSVHWRIEDMTFVFDVM